MANFFDQFDAQAGTAQSGNYFDQFDAPAAKSGAAPAILPEIGSGVMNALKSAASSVTDNLNPFSDARHASYAAQADAPIGDALKQNLAQIGGVGGALATPITAPGNVASAVTTPLVAHPFQALNNAAGIDLPYDQAKDQAATALSAVRPSAATPVGIRTMPAPVPTAPELKSAAVAGYDAAKNSGVEIKPSSLTNFTAKLQGDLNADGLNEVLAPKTFNILDKLGNAPPGATVTTNDFRTLQRALGYAAKSIDPTEKLAANRAIEALNDHLENLPSSDLAKGPTGGAWQVSKIIKEANANYAAYKRSDDFAFRGEKAKNLAAGANSGLNLENNLRSQVRQILNNKNAQRGYDPEMMAAFRAFNRGSRNANILRAVGNILGGGGGVVGTSMSAGTGFLAGGPVGAAALPIAGLGLRMAGNARTAQQFGKLAEMIRAKSPLAASRAAQIMPSPNPALGLFPAQLPNYMARFMPMLVGQVPAYADQNK